ncbi:hypothetical protein QQS21_010106 [Conoideocrella luteorostrata]|uniref:Fe2OG dioxygenase domain-containing protein n=1 Tax=Conoideocrella luteorostrata TaxID=1105319 RepID=A0AAJ0CGN5_9HYPO|nr:hypothetical protein QQS21_010106 [Conoideocrella luteorostrata]
MAAAAVNSLRASTPYLAGMAKSLPMAASSITQRTSQPPPSKTTMPPGFTATMGQLETFELPDKVSDTLSNRIMADAMINAWKKDGILQIAMSPAQQRRYDEAAAASKRFFRSTPAKKRACVNDSSFSGYVASGEEMTAGIADYSEIFTVTKDLDPNDPRVRAEWPCHGPCPWPDQNMGNSMKNYMADLSVSGETMLQMIELGLNVPQGSLTKYTQDGWHHMRVLRFPSRSRTNGKGKAGRGIGSHTDYGLLVIAAQDEVGGLFIRPPYQGESFANWKQSAAGMREDESGWVYVPPVPGVFTVFPGDMMQYMTNNFLQSTPHKVGLNVRERFAFAYFQEPNFKSVIKPLPGYNAGQEPTEGIHYGTHFTNMALRNYPDRISTKKLRKDGRCSMLEQDELRSDMNV